MGLVLDFVPNHMAADPRANRWWRDVLEQGARSPYARFFDIDWAPVKPELSSKLLLPVLGEPYGVVLARGERGLALEGEAVAVHYFDHSFPIDPESPAAIDGAISLSRLLATAPVAILYGEAPSDA